MMVGLSGIDISTQSGARTPIRQSSGNQGIGLVFIPPGYLGGIFQIYT